MKVRGFAFAFVVAFGSALLSAWAVGRLAESEYGHFNWEVAAVAGTGVATAMLAAFTAALAFSTAAEVKASQALAEIEQKRFKKEDEPLILQGVVTLMPARKGRRFPRVAEVGTSIVNGGRGPARAVKWEAYFRPDSNGPEIAVSSLLRGAAGVLTPGERHEIRFPPWVRPGAAGRFGVRGVYSDRDGEKRLYFGREPLGGWEKWWAGRTSDPWWNPGMGE
jgi:hypothetical protein